jgi:hypothetical protein
MTRDFTHRNHWTVFSSAEAPGATEGVDVRVSPDSTKVAALFSSEGTMITKGPLHGTSAPAPGSGIQSAFLVIMPATA